jgi:tetratricopeptide (TPR) repeat protein
MSDLNVTSLFTRYLERQTGAVREGLALPDLGDALPHDLTPVQPIDPQLAWNDALLAATALGNRAIATPPADWAVLVNSLEPAVVVAFALGNYPQQVRHVNALLAGAAIQAPVSPATGDRPELTAWANRVEGEGACLLAAGILRLAGQFTEAARLLARPVSAEWELVRMNERAALAWHQGQIDTALAIWQVMPVSAPVAFNLGLSHLVRGEHAAALPHLKQAATLLPESSPWHHLAELYAILASR